MQICYIYAILMMIEVLFQFVIIAWSQFDTSTFDVECPISFLRIVDIHLYYKHVICLVQSFFVFYIFQFIAPLLNAVMAIDLADEHQPFD